MFAEQGKIIADTSDDRVERAAELIAEAGHIDVLVANLAAPANLGVSAFGHAGGDMADHV